MDFNLHALVAGANACALEAAASTHFLAEIDEGWMTGKIYLTMKT